MHLATRPHIPRLNESSSVMLQKAQSTEQGKCRGNIRNSFYAHKFMTSQGRPNTQHQISLTADVSNPNSAVNSKHTHRPNSSKISNNFMGSKTENFRKAGSISSAPSSSKISKKLLPHEKRENKSSDIEFENIVSDMNEYFSMMKQNTFAAKKPRLDRKSTKRVDRIRMNSNVPNYHHIQEEYIQRFMFWPDEHLNVRGLRPTHSGQTSCRKIKG